MSARRGRGDGTIRQRKNGIWEALLRYTDPFTDMPERLSLYAATRPAVVEKLDEARARLRRRERPWKERVELSRFLDRWLEDVVRPTLRAATYRSYASIVDQHLKPSRLGKLALHDLNEAQIQHVLVARSKATVRIQQLSLIVLRRALEQAVRWKLISANPAEAIVPPRSEARELRTLSPMQARRFLRAAQSDRLYALYYLAIHTGLRQGELLALEWDDVDLDAGTIRVVRSMDNHTGMIGPVKTRASRRPVAIGAGAIDVLKAHKAMLGREGYSGRLIFPNTTGGPLSPQNVRNRSFLPLQKTAKIDPPLRFHDLRHTAATLMLGEGVHPKIVSERLGHATIAITMDTYQHVSATMQRDAATAIDAVLSPRRRKGGSNGGTKAKRPGK